MILRSRKLVRFTVIYAVPMGDVTSQSVIGIGTSGAYCDAYFRDWTLGVCAAGYSPCEELTGRGCR